MKSVRLILIFSSILAFSFAIFFIFTNEKVLVFQPKGLIAKQELNLIHVNLILMLIILVPTFIWLLAVLWKYSKAQGKHDPEKTYGRLNQMIIWALPSLIVLVMAIHTWKQTHQLDPYRRISAKEDELVIQVVAIDWKWLFIYPEQGIASVNFVQFPEKKAIRFELAADGSPMNSFWIPELSGQIYCMTGMMTPLHIMADGVGSYRGKAAEINGEGYAKMNFVAKSSTQEEFSDWVEEVKQSALELDLPTYKELLKPSIDHPMELYRAVEADLFDTIIMKYMHP